MKKSRITRGNNLMYAALIALALTIGASPAHAALGIDFTSDVAVQGLVENGGPNTFGATSGYTVVGWSFTPTTNLYLTRLGVYDADRERIHSEQHQVGIWSVNQTLLTSVSINEATLNVPETSPKGALFHFVNTSSPVLLNAGQTYFVGATMYAGAVTGGSPSDFDSFTAFSNGDSPVFINPYLTYLENGYAINGTNSLVFPSSTFLPATYTIGANIDVTPVPIPASAALFGFGLLGLAGIRIRWS